MTNGLGRRPAPDPRDNLYKLRRLAPHLIGHVPREDRIWLLPFPALDQGASSTCTGHGWKHWLMAAPTIIGNPASDPTALAIYRLACTLDEFGDNDDGNPDAGSSVRGAAQAIRSLDYLNNFAWADDVEAAIDWLVSTGPLVAGFNWYSGMMEADRDGFVNISGDLAGGHCICVNGWSEAGQYFHFIQSWGPSWGLNGYGRIRKVDMVRLLAEEGEICTAIEIRPAVLDAAQVLAV